MTFVLQRTFILQVSLVLVTASGRCHSNGKRDCPRYSVIEKRDGYEVRKYERTMFARARTDGRGSLYMLLFRYIGGANKDNVKIPMTVPVLSPKEFDGNGGFKPRTSMMFWIPQKFQNNPPVPISKDVKLEMQPDTIYYVRTFGGWAKDRMVMWHTEKLHASLKNAGLVAGVDFDDSMVIKAGFNSPWKRSGRTNEVMVPQKTRQ